MVPSVQYSSMISVKYQSQRRCGSRYGNPVSAFFLSGRALENPEKSGAPQVVSGPVETTLGTGPSSGRWIRTGPGNT
ncbi:hypothetical protein AVEN_59918-1, partial [Araneus ventricosus]